MSEPLEGAFEPSADAPLTAIGFPTAYPAADRPAVEADDADEVEDLDDVGDDDGDDDDDDGDDLAADAAGTERGDGAAPAPRKRRRRGSRGGRNRNRQRRDADDGAAPEPDLLTASVSDDLMTAAAPPALRAEGVGDDEPGDDDHGGALRGLIRRPQIGDTRPAPSAAPAP